MFSQTCFLPSFLISQDGFQPSSQLKLKNYSTSHFLTGSVKARRLDIPFFLLTTVIDFASILRFNCCFSVWLLKLLQLYQDTRILPMKRCDTACFTNSYVSLGDLSLFTSCKHVFPMCRQLFTTVYKIHEPNTDPRTF
jgi:hypothetical protein